MSRPNQDIAALMAAATAREDAGDAAAKDALFETLYDELHRLAQSHLRPHRGGLHARRHDAAPRGLPRAGWPRRRWRSPIAIASSAMP